MIYNTLSSEFVSKGKTPSRQFQGKRKLADLNTCKLELKKDLGTLFIIYEIALEKTNSVLAMIPPQSRSRTLEPSIMQSCFAEALFDHFDDKAFFGKYKRLILRIKGYVVLFKKLDKKGLPMNIKTGNIQSILNQHQTLDLFAESNYSEDPILYFGYKKNKFGEYFDPQLLYIDEGKVQFTISAQDLNITIPVNNRDADLPNEVKPILKGNLNRKIS